MDFLKHLEETRFSKCAKDSPYENQTYFGDLFPASETEAFRIALWQLTEPSVGCVKGQKASSLS